MRIVLEADNLSIETFHLLQEIFKQAKNFSDREKWGTNAEIDIGNARAELEYETCSGKGQYYLRTEIMISQPNAPESDLYATLRIVFEGYRNSFLGGTACWQFRNIPEFPEVCSMEEAYREQLDTNPMLVDIVFGIDVYSNLEILMHIDEYETSMPEKPLKFPEPKPQPEPGIFSKISSIGNYIKNIHWGKGDYEVPPELEELEEIACLEELNED